MKRYWLALLVCLISVTSSLPAKAVSVLVTYGDSAGEGFFDPTLGAARRNAFEAAVAQWGQTLNGSIPVRINAFFDPQGGSANSAVLAFAGPETFYEDWTGAPKASTFYSVALANQLADTDLDPGVDITATFNSDVDNSTVLGNINYYYGTDLQAGNNVDFYTIALHELCHGLGFVDTVNTNGSYALGDPSIYDLHLANGPASGATLISAQAQSTRAAALISDSLYFSGPNTRVGNGGTNAKLYAPNPYESGSSVSHLDETTYSPSPDGNAANSTEELMTPYSSANTHTIGPVVTGIMKDLGWSFTSVVLPTISINDVSVNEGNSGSSNVVLTVSLSAASSNTVTVNFTTTSGSATAGSDFTAKSGTVTFAPGQTSQLISIAVMGDTVNEADETFFVDLSAPSNATIADSRGVVTIVNDDNGNSPVNVSLSPQVSSNAPNTERLFTTVHSDPNGNTDISQAFLQLNTSPSGVGALRCYYAATNNLLFLLNDAGTAFLGGFAPGSNNVISNSRGSLNCAKSSVTRSGNSISIVWSVTPTTELAGLRLNCYLFTRDKANLIDNFEAFGTWTITGNVAPVNVSLSPTAVTANLGVSQNLTATYSDGNGANTLSQVILRVGNSLNDCVQVFYDQLSDKLYLLNDNATGYLGGFAPGTNNVITSSRGTLDCSNTTVTRNGNTLTVKWNISVTNKPWAGTKQNVWMFCRDRANAVDSFEVKGSWTVGGNTAPTNVSITPNPVSSGLNSIQTLTAFYNDVNGAANFSQVILRVGNNLTSGFQVFYDVQANKLYLSNDAGTGYLGGFTPGANITISNSRAKLHCLDIAPTFAGNDLIVNWKISLTSSSYVDTTQNVFLFCRDRGNLIDGYDLLGSWQITGATIVQNSSVKILNNSPSSATADTSTQTVTLTFADNVASSAKDSSNFAAQINGVPSNVVNAKASGNSVALKLSTSFLHGDEIAVAWQNLPGSGTTTIKAD